MSTLRKWFPFIFRHRQVDSMSSDNYVDLRASDSDSPSNMAKVLSMLSGLIKTTGVSWFVIGDLLLVHYLVSQVTEDIEICVQSENFKQVEALFDSSTDFCFRFRDHTSKEYFAHLEAFPRFRVRGMNQCFRLVTQTHYGLNPSAFSNVLDESVCGFPLLPLPLYVQGLAHVVTSQSKKNMTFVFQIDSLIDGMDIDEEWCCRYLHGPAQEYVRNKSTPSAKKDRMGSHPKYYGNLTTFIRNEQERRTALAVIGRTTEIPGSLSSPSVNNYTFPIQVMSDLHLEFPFCGPGDTKIPGYDAFECKPCAPILALLGDIGLVAQDGLFVFLWRQLLKYEKILYIMGNHEFYHNSYDDAKLRMKSFADEIEKIRVSNSENSLGEFILLDQTRVDLDDNVTVLGCTLWSHIPNTASEEVAYRLNDFRQIRQWTVETQNAAHAADATWLDRECAKIRMEEPERRIAVLTHHAPATSGTSAPRHENQTSKIGSAFATDMSVRSCWGPPVTVWASGHTHYCCDFLKHGVRILSNQRGYEGIETQHSSFRDDFVLSI